jgi:radical SAM protein with 4Fe4S-binding SPASM domain
MSSDTTTSQNEINLNLNDKYILNTKYDMRPERGRALLFSRDKNEFKRMFIPTQLAIFIALLDGKKSLHDLANDVQYLFDINLDEAHKTIINFLNSPEINNSFDNLLITANNNEFDSTKRTYFVNDFAKAGAYPSKTRKLVSPISLVLMPTFKCATRCIYCYANKRPISEKEYLPDRRYKELLKEIIDLNLPLVNFTGGDLFMHPHIFEYIEMLAKADIDIDISTKVPLNKDQISKFVDTGIKSIQISIDAPNADIADFMVQTPGWFNKITKTISNLLEAGISVRTHSIMTPYNIGYAEETALFLYSLGIRWMKFSNYNRSIYHHSDSFFVHKEEAEKFQSNLKDIRSKCPDALIIYNLEKDYSEKSIDERKEKWPLTSCSAFMDSMAICPDGTCIPCEQFLQCEEYILGNVLHKSIQEIWNSDPINTLPPKHLYNETVCHECDDFEKCHDNLWYCMRDAYNSYGTIYAPSPGCPKAPKGRKLMGVI